MPSITTQGIVLRRVEYGDSDLILTLFSEDQGRIGLMAKSARKSRKRFAGVLELFSLLQVVFEQKPGRKGMPLLQEAVLVEPYSAIRESIWKTAHASYWSELVLMWLEEAHRQPELFLLLTQCLAALSEADADMDALTMIFQCRFMILAGLGPNLKRCLQCRRPLENLPGDRFAIEVARGGLICAQCHGSHTGNRPLLARGTIKQLEWIGQWDLTRARRVRFSRPSLLEAQVLLEAFIPYHLGKPPRSLKVLQQLRKP